MNEETGNDTFLGMQVLPFDQRSETMSLEPGGQLPCGLLRGVMFIPMAIITKQSDADVLPFITDWHPALAQPDANIQFADPQAVQHLSRQ